MPTDEQALTKVHGRGEYVNGDCHVNSVESFWTLTMRTYRGTHHWWSSRHMQRYLDELTWRLNNRDRGVLGRMEETVKMMCGKRLRYAELVG